MLTTFAYMSESQQLMDYKRIAQAIHYIKENFKNQPSLEELAEKVNLSPFHFQRLFSDWAGVSPKQFTRYLSVTYAKQLLGTKQITLFDTAQRVGLSGTGRLHDLFVKIEGMSPGEFKNGAEHLIIHYHFDPTRFGLILIASTTKGICHLSFVEDETLAYEELQRLFPKANFVKRKDEMQERALRFFTELDQNGEPIKMHLKGTDFQLKVWEALLKIPFGRVSSYGEVASQIGNPKASRAVGSAIGDNPIAFIIPCHRVIQGAGTYGEYRWGSTRKSALIGWEAARVNGPDQES